MLVSQNHIKKQIGLPDNYYLGEKINQAQIKQCVATILFSILLKKKFRGLMLFYKRSIQFQRKQTGKKSNMSYIQLKTDVHEAIFVILSRKIDCSIDTRFINLQDTTYSPFNLTSDLLLEHRITLKEIRHVITKPSASFMTNGGFPILDINSDPCGRMTSDFEGCVKRLSERYSPPPPHHSLIVTQNNITLYAVQCSFNTVQTNVLEAWFSHHQ